MIALVMTIVPAFINPTTKLESGKTVTLLGRGPPVVFSSGFFGVSTWRIYSDLLKRMSTNVTVAAVPGPVTANDIQQVTEAIGVDRVGFVSHSAFDPNILASPRLARAVVCDPITLPLTSAVDAFCPTLVVRSELLFDDDRLPQFNRMHIEGDVEEFVFENVGHTDLLNDWWADVATSTKFWRSTRAPATSFEEWSNVPRGRNPARDKRKTYRGELADRITTFLLPTGRDVAVDVLPPLSSLS